MPESPEPLTIVARMTARDGQSSRLEAALRALVVPSRADAGCLQYDLHRSAHDPGLFLFFERWETRESWQAHMRTPHLESFQAIAGELVETSEILEMGRIE